MMPMRHCPGTTTPGQFGPTSRVRAPRIARFARAMSSAGMPSVMQQTSSRSASAASRIASAAPGGGTNTTEAFAPVSRTASPTVSKIGRPSMRVPPLPGWTPATTAVPYSSESFVWNWPIRPMPWTRTRVCLPARIATSLPPRGRDRPLRGLAERLGRRDVEPRRGQDLPTLGGVRALEAHHERHLETEVAGRGHDALGDQVAAHDAAENIHQDGADVRIAKDQLERLLHLLLVRPAAGVEEVRRTPAAERDHVERRHREARAVHHAADVAFQPDVREVDLLGRALPRVLLLGVPERRDVGVPVERVVVEVELAVEREELPLLRDDERVDLDQRAIFLDEQAVAPAQEGVEPRALLRVELECTRDLPDLVALERDHRVDEFGVDALGRLRGDLFDVHAARGGCDHREALRGAVERQREIELARDLRA